MRTYGDFDGLGRFSGREKQSQTNPIYLAPGFIRGFEKQFEKTKPIVGLCLLILNNGETESNNGEPVPAETGILILENFILPTACV
jgi:hypothetical protein